MSNLKIKLLTATSIVVFMLCSNPLHTMQAATIGVPTTRGQARDAYTEMSRKGDVLSQKIIHKYGDFSNNLSQAKAAVAEYNEMAASGHGGTGTSGGAHRGTGTTGGPGLGGGAMGIAEMEELRRLRQQASAGKLGVGGATSPSPSPTGTRDYQKEYEEIFRNILTGGSPQEQAKWNQQLGQLEREAKAKGILLGEAAELAEAEKLSTAELAQKQAQRDEQKRQEAAADRKAYEAVMSAGHPATPAPSVFNLFLLAPAALLLHDGEYLGSEVKALKIAALIAKEKDKKTLFALRHLFRLIRAKNKLNREQDAGVSVVETAVDRALESLGVVKAPTGVSIDLKETPENAVAYHKLQHILSKKGSSPEAGAVARYFEKLKTSDAGIALLLVSPGSLKTTVLDIVKMRTVGFNNYTVLEIQAFIHAFNQANHASYSNRDVQELQKRLGLSLNKVKAQPNEAAVERAKYQDVAGADAPLVPHQGHHAPPPPPQGHNAPPPPPGGQGAHHVQPPPPPQVAAAQQAAQSGPWVNVPLTAGSPGAVLEGQLVAQGMKAEIANEVGNAVNNPTNNTRLKRANAAVAIITNREGGNPISIGVKYRALNNIK